MALTAALCPKPSARSQPLGHLVLRGPRGSPPSPPCPPPHLKETTLGPRSRGTGGLPLLVSPHRGASGPSRAVSVGLQEDKPAGWIDPSRRSPPEVSVRAGPRGLAHAPRTCGQTGPPSHLGLARLDGGLRGVRSGGSLGSASLASILLLLNQGRYRLFSCHT